MSSSLFVIATITANHGHAQKVHAALNRAIAPTRAEQGCERYELFKDNNNDHRLVLQEQWVNKAALEAHFLTSHFKALVENISPIASIEIAELDLIA